MREILFKAKRIDNGEWVEGLLWKKKYNSDNIFISCFPDKDDNEEVYVVDTDTICQYIGLDDMKDNKIFEHDIVMFCGEIYRVEWNERDASFVLKDAHTITSFRDILGSWCNVMGNTINTV